MTALTSLRKGHVLFAALLLIAAAGALHAQEESKQEEMYREDYERFTKIKALSDPQKRCDAFYDFLKERQNSKLLKNSQAEYLVILEGFNRAKKFDELRANSERFIELFPRVGETYYFYGTALNEAKQYPAAMNALAKCYLLKNPGSSRARQFLEYIYKAQNKGSLAGLDNVIKQARAELEK